MFHISQEALKHIREEYPEGCRVELTKMSDPYRPDLVPGCRGTVRCVDDTGSIHVNWDIGSSLAVIYGEDACKKLDSVKTVCYGQVQHWDERKEAVAFFAEGAAACDGSERDRYATILGELLEGKTLCSDGDKILVRDLIDPEDWQEIANIPDASEDERFGKLIGIGGHCCIQVDTWRTDGNTFVLGMNFTDRSFFHASVNGQEFFEYDEGPTRETVESDYADRLAERQIDRHEAEFGADGNRAFPNMDSDFAPRNFTDFGTYTITDSFGKKIELAMRVELYEVEDFLGETLPGLAIVMDQVNTPDGVKEQYGVLTVSFGEFIGVKNCAYIDTNNNPFAEQLLQYGIAQQTGSYKESGFCSFPLWQFNEDFLHAIGGKNYKEYSDAYDRYMEPDREAGAWRLVSTKEVTDSDGFNTEYSWYTNGNRHVFVFGDTDLYGLDLSQADWECESEKEAREWFDSYEGLDLENKEDIKDDFDFGTPSAQSLDEKIRVAREKGGDKAGTDTLNERYEPEK